MQENQTQENQLDDAALFAEAVAALEGDDNEEVILDDSEEQESEESMSDWASTEDKTNEDKATTDNIEELKAQLNDLTHYKKSNEGRVAALQKKIDEYEKEKASQASKVEPEADKNNEDEIDKNFADILEIAPEFSPLLNEFKSLKSKLSGIDKLVQDKVITPAQAVEEAKRAASEAETFLKLAPDAREIEADQKFWDWLDAQPHQIQKMAESDHAVEAAYAINLFKNSRPVQQSKKQQRNVDDMMVMPREGNARSQSIDSLDDESMFAHYAKLADAGKL